MPLTQVMLQFDVHCGLVSTLNHRTQPQRLFHQKPEFPDPII